MPGKSRFSGGSLLGPVAPLPDDDDETQESPPSAPESGVVEEAPAEPVVTAPEPQAPPVPAPAAVDAAVTERGRKGPPGTLRVNDNASTALWAAYLEAKTADPFLSFRQFTSGVVMDGLNHARRRAARRS